MLMRMIEFALAAAGLAALVRVSPWAPRLLAMKPLSCVACMAGHASWILMFFAWLSGLASYGTWSYAFLLWLGATGGATVLLAQTGLFVQGFTFES